MFLDDIFSGYNPGAFEGGAMNTGGAQLGGYGGMGAQLGGYGGWAQLGGYGGMQPGGMGVFNPQNQLFGSPFMGSGLGDMGGGLGALNYANSGLGSGPSMAGGLLQGGSAMAKPMGGGLGMLGRMPMQNGRMRNPRNPLEMRQALGRAFGPMMLGRMGLNAY